MTELAEPTRSRWKLSTRLTVSFLLTTTLLMAVLAGAGTWVSFRSVFRELDALVLEELEETRLNFYLTDREEEDFARVTSTLQSQHPQNPMAWRVWDPSSRAPALRMGTTELLRALSGSWPELAPKNDEPMVGRLGPLVWGVTSLDDGRLLGVAFDGSAQLGLARNFGWIAVLLVAASALTSWIVGRLLGARIATQLERVAESMRGVQGPGDEVRRPHVDAPEEIREVSEALSEMLGNIQEELQNSRLMTAGLAHELRSPIQNVLGSAEVSLLRERTPEVYQETLRRIVSELRELGRVVDNLVTLSASDDYRRQRSLEHFDLSREVTLRLTREVDVARERGIDLQLRCTSPLTYAGDREAILLALRNIVMNAIEWSAPGDSIRVQLAERPVGGVEILVDDGGPGVAEEERERIFRPFYRGPQSHGRRIGYGLGLALALTAVESHSGDIAVETSPLGGARFKVRLPPNEPQDHATGQ